MNEDGIIGAESFGFPFPVLEQGGGANDEGGLGKSLFFAQSSQQAEGLDGLPESHLVGEDTQVDRERGEGQAAVFDRVGGWIRTFVEARGGEGGEIARGGARFPLGGGRSGIGFQGNLPLRGLKFSTRWLARARRRASGFQRCVF